MLTRSPAASLFAAAGLVVVLTSCSVKEPVQPLQVLGPPCACQAEGKKETDDAKGAGAAKNAGLRAGFTALC